MFDLQREIHGGVSAAVLFIHMHIFNIGIFIGDDRSDFGINPKAPEDKVADTIDLTLSIAGASPR